MRFHLIGDFRFPPNRAHIFDSYNSKIFRFLELFQENHIIFVYGASGADDYFTHINTKYKSIIDISEYNIIDVFDPNIMLADRNLASDMRKLGELFRENAVTAIKDNYQENDIVVSTVPINGLPNYVICVDYSIAHFCASQQYITCESNFVQQKLLEIYHPKICRQINPYFSPSDFPIINIEREPHTYLYLGRCSFVKGLARFMLIADWYRNHNLPGKFIVAGSAINAPSNILRMVYNDGTYYDYDLDLHSNVEYIGIADNKMRNELLRRATCLIQLSEYEEPLGYNVIEAQYCGCPVIANNNGGFKETVIPGKTGFLTNDYLCPWSLNYEIVEKSINALRDIDKIKSHDCTDHVKKFFDKETIYSETMEVFESIIAAHTIKMSTIHTDMILNDEHKKLLRALYYEILYKDDKFHYFWEPYAIIRISNNYIESVAHWLHKHKVEYYIYDYPKASGINLPPNTICHNEHETVINNLPLFISLFHNNSVSGLILPPIESASYRERLIHTLYNNHHIVGKHESDELRQLATARDNYNAQIGL